MISHSYHQYEAAVDAYIAGVLDETIPAGRLVRLAVERHIQDMAQGENRGLHFDRTRAGDACAFFATLKHSKGEWAGKPFELSPSQMFITWALFGWQCGEYRRFSRAHIEVARKWGKALALDTPVPTPSGWTTMGELRTGDQVFDEIGNVCRVTEAYPVMWGRPCYKMRFAGGEEILADANHKWVTEAKSDYRDKAPKVRTTQDIQETLKYGARQDCNHTVSVAGPLACEEIPLEVDPYLLGVWLGDGTNHCSRLTVHESDAPEILRWVAKTENVHVTSRQGKDGKTLGVAVGTRVRGTPALECVALQARLKAIGVLKNKHIPAEYLRASYNQRLALLQGLMDTDGYVDSRGWCEFCNTNKQLADGVLELVQTLGIKATVKVGSASLSGRVIGDKYRIRFKPFADQPAFRLARKWRRQASPPSRRPRCKTRTIEQAVKCNSVPVRCIAVDSKSRQFLVGRSFIPTHNSEYASGLALKLATMDFPLEPGAEVLLCATKEDQVRDTTFKQCCRMVERASGLARRLEVSKKSIYVPPTDKFQPHSVLKPVGSDSATSDGFDTSAAVLDELHAWKKHHHEHYDKMTTAGGSRRQELVLIFTTAGNDESELWIQLREQAVRAVESVDTKDYTADHIFAFIACIDEDDDPLSLDLDSDEFERIMQKANPNYPITPKRKYIRQQAMEAKSSMLARNRFNRFHANVRVSSSIQPFSAAKWLQHAAKWNNIKGGKGAFDVGGTDDFAAWAVVWRDESEKLRVMCRTYTCAERRKELQTTQIQRFIDLGELIEHPKKSVDPDKFRDDMVSFALQHGIWQWAFDPRGASVIAQQLERKIGLDSCVVFQQHHGRYNEPTKRLLKEYEAGVVVPEPNECLAWQFRNVSFDENARGEVMPKKGLSQEYKIDGAVAVIMAYALLTLDAKPQVPMELRAV